ncbi:MAG: peptidoglycan DD-metalloendopeptidase family protein [Oligoflexia bacterium]|nr:peptidoglycan DD-metalloendopeptidase family protein [Oligoflexia bacterium]
MKFSVLLMLWGIFFSMNATAQPTVPPLVPWFEFHVENFEQSYQFYSKVFGWTCQMTSKTSCNILQSGSSIGEIIEKHPAPNGNAVLLYITVDNVQTTYKLALSLGATTVYAPMKVPGGSGTLAVFKGPNGISVGIYSDKSRSNASSKSIDAILLHPIYDSPYSCAEHWDGQFDRVGDALGTDCLIGKIAEENGRTWFRNYIESGGKNEDWYGWHQNVLSPVDGTVVKVNVNQTVNIPGMIGTGIASFIVLKAKNGTMVLLAHIDSAKVKAGDVVKAGEAIARVGNNGQARSPHIHIGAWRGNTPLQIRFDQTKMKSGQ